jgi:hypothetical protein|mmetsp:Transcript_11991/g.21789  ORF Transcript_11991/g.21789 Transcript_11991/m.21789 type:complete len:91 (+) Transcript_11991:683-955(+)
MTIDVALEKYFFELEGSINCPEKYDLDDPIHAAVPPRTDDNIITKNEFQLKMVIFNSFFLVKLNTCYPLNSLDIGLRDRLWSYYLRGPGL